MADEYHRCASLADGLDQIPGGTSRCRIKARRHFIQEDNFRLLTSARATNKRCRWPPERLAKLVLRLSARPHCSSNCSRLTRLRGAVANRSRASQTLRRPGSADSCNWLPIRRRRLARCVQGSRPRTRIWPPSACRSPCRHSTVVVLPAPLGPSRPKISPAATSKDTSSTATIDPYILRSPRTSMTICIAILCGFSHFLQEREELHPPFVWYQLWSRLW